MRPETRDPAGGHETLRHLEIAAMPMARPQGRQSLNVSCLTRSQCLAVSMSRQVSCLRSLVSPLPHRQWHAIGSPSSRAQALPPCAPPCAHQRLATASHKAKRPAKTFRPSKRPENGVRPAQKLFSNHLARAGEVWCRCDASKTRLDKAVFSGELFCSVYL